ncbi:MAG: hypothetical protein M3Z57_01175 [Candidatus Dormibacteraeota bacterium]|nr:hypothetical protein [Candidatus Dormibacteraeota bacterium]
MSTAVFYVLAVLIVVAALGAVLAPSTRIALLAVMAGDVLVGILLIAAGAYLLGMIALVLPTACLLAVAAALRRFGYAPLLGDIPGRATGWPLAAAIAGGIGVLLFWTAAARIDDTTHSASGGQDLLTVLHYRTPIGVGVLAILAIVAVGGALMIGRVGEDERILDRAAEQRRLREERARMRREHRAAARAMRTGSDGGGAR